MCWPRPQQVTLRAHNVTPGMVDYKSTWIRPVRAPSSWAVEMMRQFADVLESLRIDPRSLDELEQDWTTSMELAETLQRLHKIPFRVGHHFASEVVVHARAHGYAA